MDVEVIKNVNACCLLRTALGSAQNGVWHYMVGTDPRPSIIAGLMDFCTTCSLGDYYGQDVKSAAFRPS